MDDPKYSYDIFIAHASPDLSAAETLFDLLSPKCRVFLASRCLRLGDDWDLELAKAQRKSRITVVLISSKTEKAYYQREEIAAALDMARKSSGEEHRVVPIYLDEKAAKDSPIPYGLRIKHGATLKKKDELRNVANDLMSLLEGINQNHPFKIDIINPANPTITYGKKRNIILALAVVLLALTLPAIYWGVSHQQITNINNNHNNTNQNFANNINSLASNVSPNINSVPTPTATASPRSTPDNKNQVVQPTPAINSNTANTPPPTRTEPTNSNKEASRGTLTIIFTTSGKRSAPDDIKVKLEHKDFQAQTFAKTPSHDHITLNNVPCSSIIEITESNTLIEKREFKCGDSEVTWVYNSIKIFDVFLEWKRVK